MAACRWLTPPSLPAYAYTYASFLSTPSFPAPWQLESEWARVKDNIDQIGARVARLQQPKVLPVEAAAAHGAALAKQLASRVAS